MKLEPYKYKKKFLDDLYYEIGKQRTDYYLFQAYENNKVIVFTRWKTYIEIQSNNELIRKINNRTSLNNEIIFDLDQGGMTEYLKLIQEFKKEKIYFYAYATKNGRARHIHSYWYNLDTKTPEQRKKIREYLLKKYNCDLNLSSDKHPIQLEYTLHYKTNEIKQLIDKNEVGL